MELPKNITQIGEADKHCRIYVEDYVVSYIKQMNGMAQNKDIAIALYGRKTVEDGVAYLFAYGAGKLTFLQKNVRHLSQAQEQEIERIRKKYFSEMKFLGYRVLNGEMVEGFQICDQDICRYVEGYAQFYEKNDSMLAYMLENRGEEVTPEKVDQEKYEIVKKRQEDRRQRQEVRQEKENIIQMPTVGLRRMKMAATGVFVLLCVMALALMQQESAGDTVGDTARQAMSSLLEQKLPDTTEEQEQVSTLVAEDKLENALREENAAAENGLQETEEERAMAEERTMENKTAGNEEMTDSAATDVTAATENATGETTPEEQTDPEKATETPDMAETVQAAVPTAYIIKRGDTLIGISLRNYGSNKKVSEICSLNGIQDPDDIKIGQEILLP